MIFYAFDPDKHIARTAHLSPLADLFFRRMLDIYYIRECPLPKEISKCCQLVRARKAAEKLAVENVLSEFFELTDDGWLNKKCEKVIASYRKKSSKAKASANARWQSKKSDEKSEGSDYDF